MNKTSLYLIYSILILLLAFSIYYFFEENEQFSSYDYLFPKPIPRQMTGGLQYAMIYPDAIENHKFPPSIEGCTQFCKKLNTGILDTATCMNTCMLSSGYIPRLDMLTDKQELVDYL